MHITNTSSKELAAELNVNPSWISLLRTGKRKLSKNQDYSRRLAAFFAHRCFAPFQRQALSEMTGVVSISPTLPEEDVADFIERWILGLEKTSDIFLSEIQNLPEQMKKISDPLPAPTSVPMPEGEVRFFYGEAGRREALLRIIEEIRCVETPGSILFAVDDNLEWLLSDYAFTRKIQKSLMELAERGFTFYQITPPLNYINRYAESLPFWLPLYATGQTKVFYYRPCAGHL